MMLFPNFDEVADLPPRVYDIMKSLANTYYPGETVTTAALPNKVKSYIFDFTYPYPVDISNNYNKNKFEEEFLKHFMLRRINYETFTAFKIMLEQKLYSLMPKYQMLLTNAMLNYDLGRNSTKTTATNTYIHTDTSTGSSTSNGTNSTTGSTTTKDTDKYSDTPQGLLSGVDEDRYLTDYRVKDGTGNTSTSSTGTDTSNTTNQSSGNNTDNIDETVVSTKGITESIEYQKEFMSVWVSIFNECESLFFGVEA